MERVIQGTLGLLGYQLRRKHKAGDPVPTRTNRRKIPEISDTECGWIERCRPYTMTTVERQWALLQAIRHIEARGIAGDIVECGVWRGGNLILAGLMRRDLEFARAIHGFDTFAGMSEPTEADVTVKTGEAAEITFREQQRDGFNAWCYAPEDDVRNSFERETGSADVVLVKGKCEETLRDAANLPERIALLRLDTDWYESTKVELEVLYPRLVSGGVLIIDDYGMWQGSRQATDEHFRDQEIRLHRIDDTSRLYVKP